VLRRAIVSNNPVRVTPVEGPMAIKIARRKFVAALGSTAFAWPLAVRAQQPVMPVIGWLSGTSAEASKPALGAFQQALGETGYVEGRNVQFEYRWADGQYDRLPAMAVELVARGVALIASGGGEPAAYAAKAATSTIPVVMVIGDDPVQEGLVASLSRPGANITGATLFAYEMESKRLGLLHEAVPAAKTIAVLFNPANPTVALQVRDVRETAQRLGVELIVLNASAESEFEGVFTAMTQQQAGALLVGANPFFFSRRTRLIALAAQYRLPAIYEWREFALDGGLMSYGTVLTDAYSQAGNYAGRILKGEKPGDLPVVQPTKYQFVINLKTAKSLGLEFSPTLSARADQVIE
jgi:putative tryptophan/tyrosine transport system substrate-binding protein